jgi:hypothetical protein
MARMAARAVKHLLASRAGQCRAGLFPDETRRHAGPPMRKNVLFGADHPCTMPFATVSS